MTTANGSGSGIFLPQSSQLPWRKSPRDGNRPRRNSPADPHEASADAPGLPPLTIVAARAGSSGSGTEPAGGRASASFRRQRAFQNRPGSWPHSAGGRCRWIPSARPFRPCCGARRPWLRAPGVRHSNGGRPRSRRQRAVAGENLIAFVEGPSRLAPRHVPRRPAARADCPAWGSAALNRRPAVPRR